MRLFKPDSKNLEAPDEPPSYDQLEQSHGNEQDAPQYGGSFGPDEYPEEKKAPPGSGHSSQKDEAPPYTGPPSQPYMVVPQQVNIAYETDDQFTRPGYREYLLNDPQRVAQGNGPRPRDAFGRGGAPLAPSNQGLSSSRGFPGGNAATYHNAANK